MRTGLSTSAFYGKWETEEAAAVISRLPVDCAEVFLQTSSEYSREFARIVRENLKGVPCTSIHPLGTVFENALISRSARQRSDAFDVLRRVLDAGCALGAKAYVYHGRNTPRNEVLPWNLQLNADMLGPMCEEAAQRGMVIAWENVCWCQLTVPERAREAREALKDVRFTLDIKQAMKAGCNPIDFVQAMGDRLINVHVCDWDAQGKLCLPGEGTFDFAGLACALLAVGYSGPVVIEPYLALIKSDEALERSIRYIKEIT
ncbi:MAG: sugar phosphate isomerase/epimerase [Clostridia bacterium]|nr:sugar phosphate isomerase/epimerase [Clostridia bacterium]